MAVVNAYLRLNGVVWQSLPRRLRAFPPIGLYGRLLHHVVRLRSARRHYFATCFLRNRPQLRLIGRLSDQTAVDSRFRIAILGCSNGAEVYSILWTVRSRRPDLRVVTHALDISSEAVRLAARAVYSLTTPELVESQLFAGILPVEMEAIFQAPRGGTEVTIRPSLKEGITWHVADAGSVGLPDLLGPQDLVAANNFLCHMDPSRAELCLRNIARLVSPGGYLCVSGVDLDVRTRVAEDLGWTPVLDLLEEIHDGEQNLRNDWPCAYWGLEPLNKRRRNWQTRYASCFRLGARA
jgi:SAM-dependent methyltransferase